MKKFFIIIIITLLLTSCTSKFNQTPNGLEYILIKSKNTNTQKLQQGDLVELVMSYEKENGEILFKSASDRKYMRKINEASHSGGCFEDGLLLMSVGDSAVFRILAENFLLKTEHYPEFPKNINSDDYIIIKVKILNLMEKSDIEHIISDKYHLSKEVELKLLEDYLKNAAIKEQANNNGLYIIKKEETNGKKPNLTDYVTIDYTLCLIDGNLIETTLGKRPFAFRLGTNAVIKGLEEAILTMRQGEKAQIIIPSDLAYGEIGLKEILPFSTLIFEVELLNVQ